MDLDAAVERIVQGVRQQHEQDLGYPMFVSVDGFIEARKTCNELYTSHESHRAHHADRLVDHLHSIEVLGTLLKGAVTDVGQVDQVLHVVL